MGKLAGSLPLPGQRFFGLPFSSLAKFAETPRRPLADSRVRLTPGGNLGRPYKKNYLSAP